MLKHCFCQNSPSVLHESCKMMNLVHCLKSYEIDIQCGQFKRNNTVMLTFCLCSVFLKIYIDYERMVQIILVVFIVINFLNLEMVWAYYTVYINVTMIVMILVVVDILPRTFYSMVLICVQFNCMHLHRLKEFCIEPLSILICSFSFEMLLLT